MKLEKMEDKQKKYIELFENETGEYILEDLSKYCHIRNTTYNDNPNRMAFNEGKRAVVLHIKSMLRMDIDKLKKAKNKGEVRHG